MRPHWMLPGRWKLLANQKQAERRRRRPLQAKTLGRCRWRKFWRRHGEMAAARIQLPRPYRRLPNLTLPNLTLWNLTLWKSTPQPRSRRPRPPDRCRQPRPTLSPICGNRTGKSGHFTRNIRSSATSDQRDVSSSTSITLTRFPAARFSTLQQRCARSMRYMVAHMQTTGDRK